MAKKHLGSHIANTSSMDSDVKVLGVMLALKEFHTALLQSVTGREISESFFGTASVACMGWCF